MSTFEPRDPQYVERIRRTFARQSLMATFGASLGAIEAGRVEITLPFSDGILQQNGFVHGGVLTSMADSASGCSALTLTEPGIGVLTVELKMNFLAPARQPSILAVGQVRKAGRTLTIAQAEVLGIFEDGGRTLLCLLSATFMLVPVDDA